MIYVGGDSYAYGSELLDISNRFGDIVSDAMGTTNQNDAIGGASNQRIYRKFFEAFDPNKFSHVILGWTGLNRFEHYSVFDQDYDGYRRITAHRLLPSNKHEDYIDEKLRKRIAKLRDDVKVSKENKVLLQYMANVRTDRVIHAEILNMILQVQRMCKYTDTKLCMFFGVQNNIIKVNELMTDHLMYNSVDWNDTWLYQPDYSLQECMNDLKLPIGPGKHFLEEGHQVAADKILEHFSV